METPRVHEPIDGETWRNIRDGLPSDSDQILGPPFPCLVWHPDGSTRIEFPDGQSFDGTRRGDRSELERLDSARLTAIREQLETGDFRVAYEEASLLLSEISQLAVARFWEIVSPEDLAGAAA